METEEILQDCGATTKEDNNTPKREKNNMRSPPLKNERLQKLIKFIKLKLRYYFFYINKVKNLEKAQKKLILLKIKYI